jgi:hypothetical protein
MFLALCPFHHLCGQALFPGRAEKPGRASGRTVTIMAPDQAGNSHQGGFMFHRGDRGRRSHRRMEGSENGSWSALFIYLMALVVRLMDMPTDYDR